MAESSIFTKEEQELLEFTKKIRVNTLNKMVENGVPESTSEIRVLNELATSLDKQVNDNAANRLKHNDNNNKEAVLDLVSELIKNSAIDKANANKATEVDRVIPKELLPTDIVDGELDVGSQNLDPADYIVEEK